MANENEKEAAARASLQYVQDGQAVGLGTGSTAVFLIRQLGERVKAGLKIRAIATSAKSRELALACGIPLTDFEKDPQLDVAIDGADEIGPGLELIKGGGGALLREKIVASAARKFVIIADSSKQVQVLGNFPLPVEVIPFAAPLIAYRIGRMGASVSLRLDQQHKTFITDEGHNILDCRFGRIADPAGLAEELSHMPGVVEHGLFLDMADVALVARGDQVLEVPRLQTRARCV
jgi:ribose 5-phosphate isomerase A